MDIFKILNGALDAIVPRRERRVRTDSRTFSDIPLSVASHDLLGTEIMTVMDYRGKEVEDLIRSLKYDHSGHAARLCATVLEDYLREEIASIRAFSPRQIRLVPVPLHKDRANERGFNQIELVLEHLPAEFHDGTLSRVERYALMRIRDTKPQTHLPRALRLTNVSGAFAAKRERARNTHVILIDDVVTTGATLIEAARTLEAAGASVTLLALARA